MSKTKYLLADTLNRLTLSRYNTTPVNIVASMYVLYAVLNHSLVSNENLFGCSEEECDEEDAMPKKGKRTSAESASN